MLSWWWLLLVGLGGMAAGGWAQSDAPMRAADLRFDFSRGPVDSPRSAAINGAHYAVEAEASYDPTIQRLTVTGAYEVNEPLVEGALLSYQVYDDKGELLRLDGARLQWDESRLRAEFELILIMLDEQPARRALRVQFNAVVEGEYWYGDRFPEVPFAAIELVNLPMRDHYRPGWTWIPGILPAQSRGRIPVSWEIGYRDEEHSGYVASMDLVNPARTDRVDSRRVPFGELSQGRGRVMVWLPLEPLEVGVVEMRPGLVWENVRWYDAEDWFNYQTVRVVPPLYYLSGVMGLALGLGLGWAWLARRRGALVRGSGRVLVVGALIWLVANLVVSGYVMVLVLLAAVAAVRMVEWRRAGMATYAVVWLMLAFLEYYWGWMNSVLNVRAGATVFAMAVWAIALLPLVFMRRKWLRRSLGFAVVASWTLASTGSVIYYQFFQDFPSVENLLYAGQVGELGDSITSLVEQRHLIPLLVMSFAMLVWWLPGLGPLPQRKTQIENAKYLAK